MKLANGVELTYCLNIHPGETWTEQRTAIENKSTAIRTLVGAGADTPFGLGLRISAVAARELESADAQATLKDWLASLGMYAFTINGFPYGQFHGRRVKEQVYAPDWRTIERRDYTTQLATILASLLPDGTMGSISTVPVSFADWIQSDDDLIAVVLRLSETVSALHSIENVTGRMITLGLEPEPACYLETTPDAVRFFEQQLFSRGPAMLGQILGLPTARAGELLRKHIGICLDTCHCAVAFEDPLESLASYQRAGIGISKAQISAALAGPPDSTEFERFSEPVYLHQVRGRDRNGEIRRWLDLPDYLASSNAASELDEVRVHYHVPLFAEPPGNLRSTASLLTDEVLVALEAAPHWEIETYTFDVLPESLKPPSVEQSVANEYEWLLGRCHA